MPSRLPQLPGAGILADEGQGSPRHQVQFIYRAKDARKIQSLDPVFTLDDLHRSGVMGTRGALHSSLAYPGLSPNFLNDPMDANSDDDQDDDDAASDANSISSSAKGRGRAPPRSPSPDQAALRGDPGRYSATSAARATLLHEKPSVVERMEKGVQACAVLRDNRHFRLFSLGVFQPAVNDVRTRSMHRVELHKHLSSTSLRAPQHGKEVRSALQHDHVGARLERMYNRVLRAVDDVAPASPPLGGAYLPGGTGSSSPGRRQPGPALTPANTARVNSSRRDTAAGMPGPGPGLELAQRSPTLTRSTSFAAAASRAGIPPIAAGPGGNGSFTGPAGGGARGLLISLPSMSRHAAAGTLQQQPGSPVGQPGQVGGGVGSQRTARSSDYWMRVTLPPEVIEAQLRHLAATTEANLRAYHEKVATAQDALLKSNGMGAEALAMAPEQMEQKLKIKLGQIQEDTTVNNFNYSALSREAVLASQLGAASKQLLTAATLPQFIRAALDHVQEHTGELAQMRLPPKPEDDGKRRSMHRRVRSKSAAPAAPPLGSGCLIDGGDSAQTLGSDSARTSGSDAADATAQERDGSGIWPSYLSMRQRAISAGLPGTTQGQTRVLEDANAHHLDHLRRHSPDSSAGERRWSPPPPAMAPNSRAHTAPAPPPPLQRPRRPDAVIDDPWMHTFESELAEVEDSTPAAPPEGLLPLPPLPPGDMDAGGYVRSRLERLWRLLAMPPTMQLDLVLAFTGRDRALQFARNLELWEQAAMAVLGREAQVEALVAVQREIEAGQSERLSLSQLSKLCVRVLRQTRWVEALAARLQTDCEWTLSYHGKPYPGSEAITKSHLLAFMEQLRQVTQTTGLRP